jgi:hypothetical protein
MSSASRFGASNAMTSKSDRAGALEAVERILNRGGDADDVLRAIVTALHERFGYAAIRLAEGGGPSAGRRQHVIEVPVEFQGTRVAELELSTDDGAFAQRIATLITPYCLRGLGRDVTA